MQQLHPIGYTLGPFKMSAGTKTASVVKWLMYRVVCHQVVNGRLVNGWKSWEIDRNGNR